MEDGLRYFTNMTDERLQPFLSPESPFPPIAFKPAEEFAERFFGLKGEKAKEYVQENIKYAVVRPFVGDTIFANEDYFGGRTEILEPYQMARTAMHEAIHARLTSRDAVSRFQDQSLSTAFLGHPLIRSLNDGLCECLPLRILGSGEGKTTNDLTLYLDQLVMAKVQLTKQYLGQNPDNRLMAELEKAEAEFLDPTSEPYYFGSVFLHVLSEYLGESEAIKVAINPFKEGINPELELSSVPKDKDLFLFTMDEIKNPHRYLEDKV